MAVVKGPCCPATLGSGPAAACCAPACGRAALGRRCRAVPAPRRRVGRRSELGVRADRALVAYGFRQEVDGPHELAARVRPAHQHDVEQPFVTGITVDVQVPLEALEKRGLVAAMAQPSLHTPLRATARLSRFARTIAKRPWPRVRRDGVSSETCRARRDQRDRRREYAYRSDPGGPLPGVPRKGVMRDAIRRT
jgi:hypothetical protein